MAKQVLATKANMRLYSTKPGLVCRCINCDCDSPGYAEAHRTLKENEAVSCLCGLPMKLATRKVTYSYLEEQTHDSKTQEPD